MTAGLKTAVKCFLCQATVPYSVDNRSRLLKHLEDQHSAFSGVDFLVAGCSMTSTERDAVRNVVQGRTPSLMQLPVQADTSDEDVEIEEREEEVDEPATIMEVTMEEGNPLASSPADEGVSPPRSTPPRGAKCPDCDMSFKLQIQLNRHKRFCVKKESVKKSSAKKLFSLSKVKQERSPGLDRRSPGGLHSDRRSPGGLHRRHSFPQPKFPQPKFSSTPAAGSASEMTRAEFKVAYPKGGGGRSNRLLPKNGKGIPCPECGKEYISTAKMNAHHVDVHVVGSYPCPGEKCGKVYTSSNKQTSHYSKNCNPNTSLGRAGLARRGVTLA